MAPALQSEQIPRHQAVVRVRILRAPTERCIDGIQLNRFSAGQIHDLPSELATLFIVERWADPAGDEPSPAAPPNTLAELIAKFTAIPRPERRRSPQQRYRFPFDLEEAEAAERPDRRVRRGPPREAPTRRKGR